MSREKELADLKKACDDYANSESAKRLRSQIEASGRDFHPDMVKWMDEQDELDDDAEIPRQSAAPPVE